MKKLALIALFFINGCTIYTEKQSEALSQNVYATNDALDKARVDLAWFYSNESTKFIKIPKSRIVINSIYESNNASNKQTVESKTRVVVVPSQYRNDKVVVVGSEEYQNLLKDREIKKQLEKDNTNMSNQLKINEQELLKQQNMHDKLVQDLNHLQSRVYKKDAIILKLIIALGITWLLIAGYLYLRINRLLFF